MASSQYNRNSSAVRRLLQEVRELQQEPSDAFIAYPLEDNLFEWHFTIRGMQGTAFEGGRYHGRLLLPNDYPFKPPNIILLTPNGRFELNKKICLSITGYHPEYWQPAWGVRTAMLALISFLPTKGEGAIGALDYTDEERRLFAKKSIHWRCEHCDDDIDYMMLNAKETTSSEADAREDISMFQLAYEGTPSNNENNDSVTADNKSNFEDQPKQATIPNIITDTNNTDETRNDSLSTQIQPVTIEQSPNMGSSTTASQPRRRRTTTANRRGHRTNRNTTPQAMAPFGFTKQQWDITIMIILGLLALLIIRRW